MIAAHCDQLFSTVMDWFRSSISYSLLRSAVARCRGAWSHRGSHVIVGALDLAVSEGQVLLSH